MVEVGKPAPVIMSAAQTCHADLVLMGSDAPPGRYEESKGTTLALAVDTAAEAERVFHALAEKGTVTMPIAETFWAVRFGMLTDQFGTPWMVNCEKPMG